MLAQFICCVWMTVRSWLTGIQWKAMAATTRERDCASVSLKGSHLDRWEDVPFRER